MKRILLLIIPIILLYILAAIYLFSPLKDKMDLILLYKLCIIIVIVWGIFFKLEKFIIFKKNSKKSKMKKDLVVTVSGKSASGKSSLILLFKDFLLEKGFDVEFDGGLYHSDDLEYLKKYENYNDIILNNIKTCKITLKEITTVSSIIEKNKQLGKE